VDTTPSLPAGESSSVDQSDWVGKVATIIDQTKGEELPTHFDPKRIRLLFWDYVLERVGKYCIGPHPGNL
jgi:hypothetical protein